MGFADYFSRNPNGAVTPPSEEDTHFNIKQINDFKFTLIQNTLRSNRSYTNKHKNQLSNNDVINRTPIKQTRTHVFCHSRYRNKLHVFTTQNFQLDKIRFKQSETKSNKFTRKFTPAYSTNIIQPNYKLQTVNVITRNRPQIETFNRPIIRRFKSPNKRTTTSNPTLKTSSS